MPAPFELTSVVHLVRPTGQRAGNLEELRAGVEEASASTLFLHALQPQIRHPAATILPPDDFSSWVNGVVQDRETAERISFAVQYHGASPAQLREGLLQLLEAIAPEQRERRDSPPEGSFVFLDLESVPVGTGAVVDRCEALMPALIEAEPSVWFYHLVEQPWLTPSAPSLVDWVRACGDLKLAQWLEDSCLTGRPLDEVRKRLVRRWRQHRLGHQVAAASERTEDERRQAGRAAVAGLVRRITGAEEQR